MSDSPALPTNLRWTQPGDPMPAFDRPAWWASARCLGSGPEAFFPEREGGGKHAEAKAMCAECPVRAACLDFALTNNIRHGCWGGKSDQERKQMRRLRRGAA